MNSNYFTSFVYEGIKYFVKYNDDYSLWLFYTKDENSNSLYVGDEKNKILNEVFTIDKDKVYFKVKNINLKIVSLLLTLNITLLSLSGCTINKKELEKVQNLPEISLEQILEEQGDTIQVTSEHEAELPSKIIITNMDEFAEKSREITREDDLSQTAIAEDSVQAIESKNEPPITSKQTIALQEEVLNQGLQDPEKSATRLEIDEMQLCTSKIIEYDMLKYQDIILENQSIFLKLCEVAEANKNLPDFLIKELISTFPRLILSKEYIDFDVYFYKVSILNYREDIKYVDNGAMHILGCITKEYNEDELVPTIIIYDEMEKDTTIHHELEHFNGTDDNSNIYNTIYLSNGRFSTIKSETGVPISIYGTVFEEGLVSLFPKEYDHDDSTSYYVDQNITNLYTHIFGVDKMLEKHQSSDKVAVLMNSVIDLGFTPPEVIDIFTRLDFYHTLNFEIKSSYDEIKFLNFQIADDIIKIYEKAKNHSFKEDSLFCALLDEFSSVSISKLTLEEIEENNYQVYSSELLNAALNKISLNELDVPEDVQEIINSGYRLEHTEVILNSFNPVNETKKVIKSYDNNINNEPGSYQRITITYDIISNEYIITDIDFTDFKYYEYVPPLESNDVAITESDVQTIEVNSIKM